MGAQLRMRGTLRWFAGQCEPMVRFSLPVPGDGGSPSLWRFRWPSLRTLQKRRDGQPWLRSLKLILLLTDLLAIALTCKRFLYALLFTGLQIKRMTFDFLDNVFGLHLALEAPQGILKGFAFLYSNLCQEKYTSKQSQSGRFQNTPYSITELRKICN
jgi:hypothetical protein